MTKADRDYVRAMAKVRSLMAESIFLAIAEGLGRDQIKFTFEEILDALTAEDEDGNRKVGV